MAILQVVVDGALGGLIVGTKVEKLMEPKQESDENTEEDKYEGMGIAGVEKLMEPKQESDENTEEGISMKVWALPDTINSTVRF